MKPKHFAHQPVDTQSLLDKPGYILFNDPGTGKSRTVIDAVCELYRRGVVDAMIAIGPPEGRSVWVDPDPVLGEFTKWVHDDVPYTLNEYHQKTDLDRIGGPGKLHVLVSNPEFVRRVQRMRPLQKWAERRKTLLVLDESWLYQTPNAKQTKAMYRLRDCCDRVVLMNGTPGEIKDQYTQFRILHPEILDNYNHQAFRAHYCVMGGYLNKKVVGYINTDEFYRRTAPYCVRRELRDCPDVVVHPEPFRTQIEATLTPQTWKHYTELRDELVTWLTAHASVTAMQAGVKTMRLAQITNGFVGGVAEHDPDLFHEGLTEARVGALDARDDAAERTAAPPSPLREIGREKLDAVLAWLQHNWSDPKLLIFTRFRPDVERTRDALAAAYPTHEVLKFYGEQDPDERKRAKMLLAPGGDPTPGIVIANAQSGGAAVNLAAAWLTIFLGNSYSHRLRRQAEGRTDRPGQTRRCTFLDVLAVGPKGQRTVDHEIAAALRRGEALEDWGAKEWLKALKAA